MQFLYNHPNKHVYGKAKYMLNNVFCFACQKRVLCIIIAIAIDVKIYYILK